MPVRVTAEGSHAALETESDGFESITRWEEYSRAKGRR